MGSVRKVFKKVTKAVKKPVSKITKGIAKGIAKVGKAVIRGVAKINKKSTVAEHFGKGGILYKGKAKDYPGISNIIN